MRVKKLVQLDFSVNEYYRVDKETGEKVLMNTAEDVGRTFKSKKRYKVEIIKKKGTKSDLQSM